MLADLWRSTWRALVCLGPLLGCGCSPSEAGSRGDWQWLGLASGLSGQEHVRLLGDVDLAPGRTSNGQYSGEGVSVRPEHPASLQVDIPPGSVLRFFTVAFHEDRPLDASEPLARLRVRLDGEEVFTTNQARALMSRGNWHTVPLPAAGAANATLEFSVTGPVTQATFFAPAIGPREVGSYVQRPWDGARPNLILFLADTFRADNLTAYGAERAHAPSLERLVERSATFLDALAPASWTLPSQASMLTGVYPPQHGAVRNRLPISEELTTIAELLADAGYRTGAVTDSGFVSSKFGFSQGFQWFEENSGRDFAYTLASAQNFIAEDDGRPFFLFVQTYRTHDPYLTGPDEDPSGWDALVASLERVGDTELPLSGHGDELRALYLAGVEGFDQRFGPWFESVETSGCLDNGYFIFTSDHGEAFGEHGDLKHGGLLWQEKIRVPLFVLGPDLAPGSRPGAVSLVDLPPTLAGLAGLPGLSDWVGRSLFDESEDARSIFAFGEELSRYPPHLAMIQGRQKVMVRHAPEFLEAAVLERAFDLGTDPGEQHDLTQAQLAWPQALCRRLTPAVELFSIPLARQSEVILDRDVERRLRELGY